jgi:dipeptidyl aminopeptidase/acylaminoacyl peptidase
MKYILLILLFVSLNAIAQEDASPWNLKSYLWSYSKYKPGKTNKRLLDFGTIDNWRGLGPDLSVSNDGKYFAYTIVKGHYHNDTFGEYDSLVIQSTGDTMRWVFAKAIPGQFTADSKQYVFKVEDTLFFLGVRAKVIKFVTNVQSYKLVTNGRNEWVVYQLNDGKCNLVSKNLVSGKVKCFSGVSRYEVDRNGEWLACYVEPNGSDKSVKDLLIYQPVSGKEDRYSSVEEYFYAKDGNALILKALDNVKGTTLRTLQYLDLAEEKRKTIWSSNASSVNVSGCSLDDGGKRVAFSTEGGKICYYEEGMDTSIIKLSNESDGIPKGFRIRGPVLFTENGKYIQFSLEQFRASIKPKPDAVQLEIRSSKDMILSYAESDPIEKMVTVQALVAIKSNMVILLERGGKSLYKLHEDFAIVQKPGREIHGDRFWEDGYYDDSTWLVSLSDGSFHLLQQKNKDKSNTVAFSPGGKFIVYFDTRRGGRYFSYDLRTKVESAISSSVPPGELGYINSYEYSSKPQFPIGIAAWLANDERVLVYGKFDIWLLDLTGKKTAVNITNGFGRLHNIMFSLFNGERVSVYIDKIPIIRKNDILLLRSFNPISNYSGFYVKNLGKIGDPKRLYFGPYFFNKIKGCQNLNLSNDGRAPVKAKDASVWVVQRQSGSDGPNYYKTSDFKLFTRLTNFQPHAGFNWLTQELCSYQHLDGKYGQGILYKPENFDSTKKYPVMIIFYQTFSDNLYQFRVPSLNQTVTTPGESPIWFLNNGYLVFTPDIYVDSLKYGPTAFNVIEGAARYLKQLSFVDSIKLGCGSHSWSAKLGSYIFTHSSSFAAIAISEGMLYADLLNHALSPSEGSSQLQAVENEQNFGNLWENKDAWLDQTTVLNVNKAKSPLLLLCNKKSTEDYQDQTFQFFNALRRLDKKVWWLKYEKGSHTIDDPEEMKDFTIRYTQYFDHYLKNAPAPLWMTQGMPLWKKGIESRYELDPTGTCSLSGKNDCPICKAWNEQHKRTPEMFQKEIKDWELDKDIADELERKQNERRKELDKLGEIQTKQVMEMLRK